MGRGSTKHDLGCAPLRSVRLLFNMWNFQHEDSFYQLSTQTLYQLITLNAVLSAFPVIQSPTDRLASTIVRCPYKLFSAYKTTKYTF